MPLLLDRIPEAERRSEVGLREAFAASLPVILGGLLQALADTLTCLPAVRAASTTRPRMADYYDVLTAYDEVAAAAYLAAGRDAMTEAAEADPFVVAVRGWLAAVGGAFTGAAADAWAQADAHRRQHGGWAEHWWPKGGPQFGTALTKATEPLRAVGIEVSRSKSNGARVLSVRTLAAGTAQGQRGTAIEFAVPAAVPAIRPGQGSVGPERDSRDSSHGNPRTPDLWEEERGVGGGQAPANPVPAVPADEPSPTDGRTRTRAPLLAVGS